MWAAVVDGVLIAVAAAVLLGRTIHRADREELGVRPTGPRRP